MSYTVSSGITSTGIILNDYMLVLSGGTANSTTVNSGGLMDVSSGGTAIDITVNSGGCLWGFSGGTATIAYNPWQGIIDSDVRHPLCFETALAKTMGKSATSTDAAAFTESFAGPRASKPLFKGLLLSDRSFFGRQPQIFSANSVQKSSGRAAAFPSAVRAPGADFSRNFCFPRLKTEFLKLSGIKEIEE